MRLGIAVGARAAILKGMLCSGLGAIRCVIAGPIDFRAPLAAVSLRPVVDGCSASLVLLAC